MGKKLFSLLLTAALLLSSGVTACAASASSGEVLITLSDSGVKVDGTPASADPADAVYTLSLIHIFEPVRPWDTSTSS